MSHWYCRRCRRRRLIVAAAGDRDHVRNIERDLQRRAQEARSRRRWHKENAMRLTW